jgi:sarcosine oxidase, subunit alpha
LAPARGWNRTSAPPRPSFSTAWNAPQNHWPSLDFDVGVVNNYAARFMPAGFYYKTFIHPRPAWKHIFEPFIRRAAGLGKAPTEGDADRYEQAYAFCDVLVIGAGVAGLKAAKAAADAGKRVILLEQAPVIGGRAPVDQADVDGQPVDAWLKAAEADLRPATTSRSAPAPAASGSMTTAMSWPTNASPTTPPATAARSTASGASARGRSSPRPGAIERPLSFAGNDIPGVMLASAVRDYVVNFAVSPGDRTVVVTNNDSAYQTALALKAAGLDVPAILDAREVADGPLPQAARAAGIRVLTGKAIAKVKGGKRVTGVAVCAQAGEGSVQEEIACEAVAMSGGWSPVVHLWSHCGGKLTWDETISAFIPDPNRPPLNHDGSAMVEVVGSASGDLDLTGQPKAIPPVWVMPQGAPIQLRSKMWLDYQNDVKVSDVQLASREGYVSVEHTKRYTTLGMATDQGKLSNINGLAVLADSLGQEIPQVGTTTFRPPYTPVTIGALAGESRGEIFQPLRRTPMHEAHEKAGAYFEPVGLWRRPYCFPRAGETHEQAVHREVLNTRHQPRPPRRLDPGQDHRQGPGRGQVPRHALHRRHVDAAHRQVPLWPDVQRTGLPLR